MSKPINNKIIAFFALALLAVAVILSVLLLSKDDSTAPKDDEKTKYLEQTNAVPTTQPNGLIPIVQTKYLWQYGSQKISGEKPQNIGKDEDDSSAPAEETTVYVPVTYYEVITNESGEAVTDESGNQVTEVHTVPQTTIYTEYVTDENGESVTDENGNLVTEIHSEVVTTAPPPVYATDVNGEPITDENGSFVTEVITTEPEVTTAVVGSRPEGATVWAEGFSDGTHYTRMKIYLDGEYDITKSSVMTLTLRESGAVVPKYDTLTYNLYKGVCTLSPGNKQEGMAMVTKSGGQTIVTLIIPEEAQPNVSTTTAFRANSTISTFRDSSGQNIDDFSVSVNLS